MGIEVSGISPHQSAKGRELCLQFSGHRCGVVFIDQLIDPDPLAMPVSPLPQIEVQADTQFRVSSSVGSSLRCARPAHHEAGAGYDATLVRVDDATVCTRTLAEVIGVDDQLFFADHGLESQILEQLRSDFRSGEILFRDGSRGLAMPSIVAIDSLNGS